MDSITFCVPSGPCPCLVAQLHLCLGLGPTIGHRCVFRGRTPPPRPLLNELHSQRSRDPVWRQTAHSLPGFFQSWPTPPSTPCPSSAPGEGGSPAGGGAQATSRLYLGEIAAIHHDQRSPSNSTGRAINCRDTVASRPRERGGGAPGLMGVCAFTYASPFPPQPPGVNHD